MLVHLEQLQRIVGHLLGDCALGAHLRKVAHAPEQPIGDARRAARAPGELRGSGLDDRDIQNAGRPDDDFPQVGFSIEIEAVHDAETRSQRRRQQPRAGRGADQREFLERHFDRARPRSLADHDVELVVFHRGIQNFFDCRRHAVNFVDEQHFALCKAREDGRQISGPLEHRPRRGAHGHAELVANHVRQCGFAETRRTVQQHVIERFIPLPRGGNRHLEVGAHALLADVVVQRTRPQPRFILGVLVHTRGGDNFRIHISRQSAFDNRQSTIDNRQSAVDSRQSTVDSHGPQTDD